MRGLAARAQQRERGECGERQKRDDQREAGDVLPAQGGGGAAPSVTERVAGLGARRWGLGNSWKSAMTLQAAGNPPRLGRERSLSFAARIVSGIQ